MSAFLETSWYGSVAASLLLSALVTWLGIRYAQRRNLLDLPGQRRSHSSPTPRGGGIGIVAAALIFFCLPLLLSKRPGDPAAGLGAALALLLVASVGWIDDHRPLSARTRVLVHFAAAFLLLLLPAFGAMSGSVGAFAHEPGFAKFVLVGAVLECVVATLIVWSINLHNFMDGINGLLAFQAIFVFTALGVACCHAVGQQQTTWQLFVLAAATLGFVPFNFPRARVFMGDVGSGALGLLIAIALGLTLHSLRPSWFSGIIACSAFVTDATCTLLSRMLRGRRWYSAHREHLYQWMARAGMPHAHVVAWYMAWNLALVAPVLWWINRQPAGQSDADVLQQLAESGRLEAIIVYALAIALWICGKRWCLHKVKTNVPHAST